MMAVPTGGARARHQDLLNKQHSFSQLHSTIQTNNQKTHLFQFVKARDSRQHMLRRRMLLAEVGAMHASSAHVRQHHARAGARVLGSAHHAQKRGSRR